MQISARSVQLPFTIGWPRLDFREMRMWGERGEFKIKIKGGGKKERKRRRKGGKKGRREIYRLHSAEQGFFY